MYRYNLLGSIIKYTMCCSLLEKKMLRLSRVGENCEKKECQAETFTYNNKTNDN